MRTSRPRTLRPCPHPGCPHLYRGRNDCPQHRPAPWQTTRTSAHTRGYGQKWRRLRTRILTLEPTCRLCPQPATQVDHMLPRSLGGTDDPTNLQPLCEHHHATKTTTEATAARERTRTNEDPPAAKGVG